MRKGSKHDSIGSKSPPLFVTAAKVASPPTPRVEDCSRPEVPSEKVTPQPKYQSGAMLSALVTATRVKLTWWILMREGKMARKKKYLVTEWVKTK